MTKKAYAIITKEALGDFLRFAEIGINITSVIDIDDEHIRFELSGDGLPVEDGIYDQVKAKSERIKDDDKSGLSAPVFAKRNDEFPK